MKVSVSKRHIPRDGGGGDEEPNHTTTERERDARSSINHSILSACYESFRFKTSDPEGWRGGGGGELPTINSRRGRITRTQDWRHNRETTWRHSCLVWFGKMRIFSKQDGFWLETPSSLLRWKICVFLTRRALLRQTEQREELGGAWCCLSVETSAS